MLKKIQPYALFISAALLVGSFSALLTGDNMMIYQTFARPPLSPPAIVFPIVWTVLYAFMGVSAALVWNAADKQWNSGLTVWAIQLIVNFFWSLIFFNLQSFLFAFIWLLVLWAMIIVMIVLFSRTSKPAALLQLPYLVWVTFAGYLNFAVWWLNR